MRAPDTRLEPGSSARAALASEASGQRGHFIGARAEYSPRTGLVGARRATPSAAGETGIGQKVQPYAWSAVFIASMDCLQLASMVDFAAGFLDMLTHDLRIWSSCAL